MLRKRRFKYMMVFSYSRKGCSVMLLLNRSALIKGTYAFRTLCFLLHIIALKEEKESVFLIKSIYIDLTKKLFLFSSFHSPLIQSQRKNKRPNCIHR